MYIFVNYYLFNYKRGIIISEIKIRVKEIIKDKLVQVKERTGLSVNFQINFAIFKYLILDTKAPLWEIDNRPNPHYDVINKLPEELKFCDGDSCEFDVNERRGGGDVYIE